MNIRNVAVSIFLSGCVIGAVVWWNQFRKPSEVELEEEMDIAPVVKPEPPPSSPQPLVIPKDLRITDEDLRQVAGALQKDMTSDEFNVLLSRINPKGTWIGDHHEAGTVLQYDAKTVTLFLIWNSDLVRSCRVLDRWELKIVDEK